MKVISKVYIEKYILANICISITISVTVCTLGIQVTLLFVIFLVFFYKRTMFCSAFFYKWTFFVIILSGD